MTDCISLMLAVKGQHLTVVYFGLVEKTLTLNALRHVTDLLKHDLVFITEVTIGEREKVSQIGIIQRPFTAFLKL